MRGKMRIKAFDRLRVFACILVVLVHVSAQGISECAVDSGEFAFCQCCNILAFSGVSIFVMMSGALALRPGKKISVKDAVIKRFLFFIGLYFLWKGIYLVFDLIRGEQGVAGGAVKRLVLSWIGGRGFYHLWYLPMIAFLSLLVPLIYESIQKREVCLLYLIPYTVLALLLPTVFYFEFPFKYLLMDFLGQFETEYFLGYLGYFILGHYLLQWRERWTKEKKAALYAAGLAALVFGCICGVLRSRADGVFFDGYSSPLSFTNLLSSSAIFVFFLHREMKVSADPANNNVVPEEMYSVRSLFSGLTLGIYLIHPMVIEFLKPCGLFPGGDEIWFMVPFDVMIVTMLSVLLVYTGKKIMSVFGR